MKRLPPVNTEPKNWRPSDAAAKAVTAFIQREFERTGKAPSINDAVNEMLVERGRFEIACQREAAAKRATEQDAQP